MVTLAASSANAVGMAVGGVLAVIVISAVFYLVGRGEDRDRAAASPGAPPATPGDATPATPAAATPDPAAGDGSATEPARVAPPRPRAPAGARRRRRP